VLIDQDIAANNIIIQNLLEEYQISLSGVEFPLFLIDQSALSGVTNIQQQADTMIELSLQNGGGPLPLAMSLQADYEKVLIEREDLEQKVTQLETSLSSSQRLSLLLLLALAVLLFSLIVLLLRTRRKHSHTPPPTTQGQGSKYISTRGEKAGFVRTLIGQGAYSVDFLAEMKRIQYEYQSTQIIPETAIYLARDFLEMAEHHLDLYPVEQIGSQVRFDRSKHKSYAHHKPRDPVWVISPGWQRKGQIIKRALVQSEKRK